MDSATYFLQKEADKTNATRRTNDRQTGVPLPFMTGPANDDEDMRKFMSLPLAEGLPGIMGGANGMCCATYVHQIGTVIHAKGTPLVANHTTTSDLGGLVTHEATPPEQTPGLTLNACFGSFPEIPPDWNVWPVKYYMVQGGTIPPEGYGWYHLDGPIDEGNDWKKGYSDNWP